MSSVLPNDFSINGLNFNRAQEGRALRAYQDSVGVWTVGYGLTNFDKNLPWKIGKGLTITEAQAEWYLYKSLKENYLPAVKRALEGGTYAHPQGAVDGGGSFHYNTGGIEKASWPGALKRGDLAAAQESLMSWNKAGGHVVGGLTRRRAAEWKIIASEDFGHLEGPSVIEPGANNLERQTGVGDLLTAYPTDPGDTSSGSIKVDGPTVPATPAPGVLKLGSTGQAVTDLQNKLGSAGYTVRVTGLFDDQTEAQVTALQHAHPNLTPDGKAGPATLAALDRDIALRGVTSKVVKTALPSLPALYIGFHNFVSAHAGELALYGGGAVFVAVAGYWAIRYRHEIHAQFNGLIGRKVA